MSVTTSAPPGSAYLDWLALSPGRDHAHDCYTGRLRDSVPRVARRIGLLTGPETARWLDAWRDVFLALPAEDARRIVAHPFFNYYWLQLLEACQRDDHAFLADWSAHFARFLAGPALAHGIALPGPVPVPTGGGQLRLPGLPRHLVFSGQDSPRAVSFHPDGDGLVHEGVALVPPALLLASGEGGGGGHTLGVTSTVTRPTLAGTRIEFDATDPWIGRLMSSMNQKPALDGYPAPDLAPFTDAAPEQLDLVGRAFGLVEQAWPELAEEIDGYVSLFVPYRSAYHSSFTEACMMGAVFLSEAMWPFSSVPYTAEHFLHEEAHLRLTLVEQVDPLVTPAEEVTYASPWRRDARPLSGLLQAAFAFARITVFHRLAYERTGDPVHERRGAQTAALLARGLDEVESGPALAFTPAGEQLWSQMRAEAVQS